MTRRAVQAVAAVDLHQWADRLEAQSQLPVLLRKLVHATLMAPSRVDFPGGEGVLTGGYDGVVETPIGNPFVPAGRSLYELSVQKDCKGKADADYEKRTREPSPYVPRDSVFVFVSLRKWGGKNPWAESRNAEGVWKEVRAYDASDLEQWLELAPPVQPWLRDLLGWPREGLAGLQEYWDEWASATVPALSPGLLLCGRDAAARRVLSWLEGPPSALHVRADTAEEAVCFLAAVLLSLPDVRKAAGLARSVVASSVLGVRHISVSRNPVILAAHGDAAQETARTTAGHHVLVALPPNAPSDTSSLLLSPLDRSELRAQLRALGLPEQRATELVRESSGRIAPLRRALVTGPSQRATPWSTPAEARNLVPLLLAGAWNESGPKDRKAIERLSGRAYAELSGILLRWLNEADPPLRRDGDVWRWVSRAEAWRLLCPYIAAADLDELERVAVEVLSERDPRFELGPDDRWLANVEGKVLSHSVHIREGLAEAVVLLASFPESSAIRDARRPVDRAATVVRNVLYEQPYETWASLSDHLPLLAEASPEVFLDAAEAMTSGDPPAVLGLFAEEKGGLSPHSYHTALLWALESLAWAEELLPRVIVLLGKLARLDPGGSLGNRPAASLRQILLGWYPQTSAPLETRLMALDALLRSEPSVGWQLLLDLLPRAGDSSWPVSKPRWRAWASGRKEGSSQIDHARHVQAVAARLLEGAGRDCVRWASFIRNLQALPLQQRDEGLGRIETLLRGGFGAAEVATIWEAAREVLHNHRRHRGAGWVLPDETLDRLAVIAEAAQPAEPVKRYSWLFSWNPAIPNPPLAEDWRAEEELADRLRSEAAQALLDAGGVELVWHAGIEVQEPAMYGRCLGQCAMSEASERAILDRLLNSEIEELLAGFVQGSFARSGWAWVDSALRGQKGGDQARILAALPLQEATWSRAQHAGVTVEEAFWKITPAWRLSDPARDAEAAVRRLLGAGRPWTALSLTVRHLDHAERTLPVPDDLLADVLVKAATADWRLEGRAHPDHVGYRVGTFLEILESNGRLDRGRLAQIEWLFLPALSHGDREPRLLLAELAASPAFFAEVVSWVYRSEDVPNVEDHHVDAEPTAEEVTRARLGYELLGRWKRIPGVREDGSFDPEALKRWIGEARGACASVRRGGIGDDQIGRVLAHAPAGADGIWPIEPVRDLIENLANRDIEAAIEVGLLNNRGVTSRAPKGGGAQERDLAREYRDNASAVASWPRTAALLRRMAESYDQEGRRWDLRTDLEE